MAGLLILSVALLLSSVLLNRLLDSVAIVLWDIMTLLLSVQCTLLNGNIVHLGLIVSCGTLFHSW